MATALAQQHAGAFHAALGLLAQAEAHAVNDLQRAVTIAAVSSVSVPVMDRLKSLRTRRW